MYEEQTIINENTDLGEIMKKSEIYVPKDTTFVFMGQEFLYLDYNKDTWAMGDVNYVDGQA